LSDRIQSRFTGPDPNGFLNIGNEDLAVADAAGLGGPPDRIDGFLYQIVGNHNFDFHLGQKINDIFRTPIKLRMTLLPAKALGFGDGYALQSNFLKRFLHLVELEWLDDGF